MADVKEECGIAAAACLSNDVADKNRALPYLYKILLNIQSRGQLSAGITTYKTGRDKILSTYRNLGSVNEVFKTSKPMKSKTLFRTYAGERGIGHVRYATCGADDRNYAQPFERRHGKKWKWFSFAFNGNIANYGLLRTELLKNKDYHLIRDTDTEVIMHLLARELQQNKEMDFKKVYANLAKKLDGAYSTVMINAYGDIVLARDPYGFKPLSYGIKDGVFLASSESNALLNCGVEEIHDVKPGHLLIVKGDKIEEIQFAKAERKSHCMFEYVYFSNVCSKQDDVSVYMTRTKLGEYLADIETLKVNGEYVVVPVPDTSKPAGDAYAYKLGLRSMEGLIRNRFVGRTFIEGSNRFEKIRNKFTVLKDVIKGKKVILVDDSIVRGSTSKSIVQYVREIGGAKEVHVRIACPPIFAPCFYGIDMSTISELKAPKYITNPNDEKHVIDACKVLAKDIDADSVAYLPIKYLVKAIGKPKDDLCIGCLTGDYPTKWGNILYNQARENHANGKKGRTYSN